MGDEKNPFEAVQAMMLENLEKMQGATQSYIDMVEKAMRGFPGADENRIANFKAYLERQVAGNRTSRIPSLDATPVTTSSPRKTGAARSSVRRPPSSSANASPLTSSTEPTRSAARAGMPARMNGSASAPWQRSQRRLQARSRSISPRSVIV